MEMLSRLDYFDIGRRYVLSRAKNINPREIDTEGSDVNLFIGAASYMAAAVARQNIERINALLIDGSEDEDLDRVIWDRYRILRKGASAAVTHVTMSRSSVAAGAGTVPVGTKVLALNGVEYVTLMPAIFSSLTTTVPNIRVRAVQAGKAYQVGANQIRRFDKPSELFDASLQINNEEPASGGEEAERNDVFRERARQFWNSARRGTLGAIEFGALDTPGVVSAQAVEVLDMGIPARLVELFVADSSGVSSRALLERVQNNLNEWRAGGIRVIGNTSRPIIVDVVLSLSFRAGVDTAVVSNRAVDAVLAYINSLPVNAPLLRNDLGAVLSRFKGEGLIPTVDSVVVPSGDVFPESGTTIRTRRENITLM